jgi:hypothetical protein
MKAHLFASSCLGMLLVAGANSAVGCATAVRSVGFGDDDGGGGGSSSSSGAASSSSGAGGGSGSGATGSSGSGSGGGPPGGSSGAGAGSSSSSSSGGGAGSSGTGGMDGGGGGCAITCTTDQTCQSGCPAPGAAGFSTWCCAGSVCYGSTSACTSSGGGSSSGGAGSSGGGTTCSSGLKDKMTPCTAGTAACSEGCGPDTASGGKLGSKTCSCNMTTLVYNCNTCAGYPSPLPSCYTPASTPPPTCASAVANGATCTSPCGGVCALPADGGKTTGCVCVQGSSSTKWSCATQWW